MGSAAANYLYHLVQAALGRRSPYRPLMAYLYLTYRCDLACSYCDDGTGRPYPARPLDRELDTDEVCRLLEIIRRETDGLIVTGGEPLARRDLPQILAHARALGFSPITVCTNGLGLREQAAMLDHVDLLLVSLDTLDESKAETLYRRGPDVIRRVRENIEQLLVPRLRRVQTYLSICVTPETVADVPAVVDYALAQGLGFTFTPVLRGACIDAGLAGSPAYRAILDAAIRHKRRGAAVMGTLAYLRGLRDRSPFVCRPLLLMRVKPNGALLYPCNKLDHEGGNLLALGSYRAAVAASLRVHGGLPTACGTRCHEGCYMDVSLMVQRPWLVLQEAYFRAKGRLLRRTRPEPK